MNEKQLKTDHRFYSQTKEWQQRFEKLIHESPQNAWDWIVGHYQGDQDDLDHMLNEYGKMFLIDANKHPYGCPRCNSFRNETTETVFPPETTASRTEYMKCQDCSFSWYEEYQFLKWHVLTTIKKAVQ